MRSFGTRLRRWLFRLLVAFTAVAAGVTVFFFPWNTDPPGDESSATRDFYSGVYERNGSSKGSREPREFPLSAKEEFYMAFARQSAKSERILEKVTDFVKRFDLSKKRVLEVGAGSGLLQDLVQDYTGLDISPSARRFFHKPFVEASATDMPFPDNSFDAVWSIWVLEHIPNPDRALREIRRVVKPGGVILLHPAFGVNRYAAQGYLVRPYGDFGWTGKLTKASAAVVESRLFRDLHQIPIRAIRSLAARLPGPTKLHFVRLTPNYDRYWAADSDAVTSVSFHETYLWFATRGDRCLDCAPEWRLVMRGSYRDYMTIQVRK
jgi:SAM-dependent methyltransferase